MRRISVAATQWNVLTFLWQHTVGKAGRDVDGRLANGLVKRGLVVKRIAYGKRGGRQYWYELTAAGLSAVEKTATNPVKAPLHVRPRTHDEDLAGALEERERLHVPQARKLQQPHEFVTGRRSKGRTGEPVCDRCGKTRFEGAHPLPTFKERKQQAWNELDQLISNAVKDFYSLETNVQDIGDCEEYGMSKSHAARLDSLKEDIQNLLDTWPV